MSRAFANWAANGDWAVQTFKFTINQALQYIALAVTGKNDKAASYVAFDICEGTGADCLLPPP